MDRQTLSENLRSIFNGQREILAALPKGDLEPRALTFHNAFHVMREVATQLAGPNYEPRRLEAFSRYALMRLANLLANELFEVVGESPQLAITAVDVVRHDDFDPELRSVIENLSPTCELISKFAAISRQALTLSAQ